VKDFNLNFDIRKILKGELTFEQKITDSAAAPEVKSAGKKKSSTKTSDKGRPITTPKNKKEDSEEVPTKKKSKFVVSGNRVSAEGGVYEQVSMAVLYGDASPANIQATYKGHGLEMSLEEAKELKKQILAEAKDENNNLEENC
jgi:hypothetical protein